jgi:hypothetical protein
MKSNLKLTQKQETELVTYLKKRIASLQKLNDERIKNDRLSWKMYENSREERAVPDTIFEYSNLSVPLTSLIVDHFVARTDDAITGTRPIFQFDAQGPSKEKVAEDYNKYFNWKLETRAKTRKLYSSVFPSIYIQRKAFMKSTYHERTSYWVDREQNVLFNKATGEPIEIFGVGLIVEGQAEFMEQMMPNGEKALVLSDDPSFVFDEKNHEYRPYPKGVPMRQVHYSGPRAREVDYDRILIPDVSEIGDADCVIEIYDKPLDWVKERWTERSWRSFEDFKKALREKNASKDQKDAEDADRPNVEDLDFDQDEVSVSLREIWLRRDVQKVGTPQDIYILWEKTTDSIVQWEYVAKMTPDSEFPYNMVGLGKNQSLVESISQYQEYVDTQFNSESYRNELSANPLTGVDRSKFENEEEEIEQFPGSSYDMKEGATIDEAISTTNLPNADSRTQELIDFVFGVVQLWLGVSNLAQGDYQALAPANTATGVEATLQEASKIGRMWMRDIIEFLEENLDKLVLVALATLDEDEVYEYMEGDVRNFGLMSPEDLRSLDVNVTVVLTQQKGQRELERNELILKIVERYLMYPTFMRPFVKPAMERMLLALGVEETDQYLPEEAPDMPVETPAAGEGDGSTEVSTAGMGNSNTAGRNQNTG